MSVIRTSVLATSLLATSACTGELHEDLPETTNASASSASTATVAVSFDRDIQADIDSLTCSNSSCHGGGLGGFKLVSSATGPDLASNYEAFKARAASGEASKVLIKGTGGDSHTGGVRFGKNDAVYTRWLTWIQEGNPR